LDDAKKRLLEAQARADKAREYFASGSARAAFLRKGIQPVEISIHEQRLKKSIFGDRYIDVTFSQRGWIFGEFLWGWRYLTSRGQGWGTENSYEYREGKFLTALRDIPMDHGDALSALIPVNKGPGGYESFYGPNRDFPFGGHPYSEQRLAGGDQILENWPSEFDTGEGIVTGWVWVELERAVRRLTGEPGQDSEPVMEER
jgi:hypothetical protein